MIRNNLFCYKLSKSINQTPVQTNSCLSLLNQWANGQKQHIYHNKVWISPALKSPSRFSSSIQQHHLKQAPPSRCCSPMKRDQGALHGDLDLGLHTNTIGMLSPSARPTPEHLDPVEDMEVADPLPSEENTLQLVSESGGLP